MVRFYLFLVILGLGLLLECPFLKTASTTETETGEISGWVTEQDGVLVIMQQAKGADARIFSKEFSAQTSDLMEAGFALK